MIHTRIPKPPENALTDPQAIAAWRAIPEVKAALARMKQFRLFENRQDVFSADDVPSGSYDLTVTVIQPPAAGEQPKQVAHSDVSVTIPSDPPSGKLDLGEITLQPAG